MEQDIYRESNDWIMAHFFNNLSADFVDWSPGTRLSDGLRIVRLLGTGGTGEVFLVEHDIPGLPIRYAVKIIRSRLLAEPEHMQSFFREIRTWSQLPEYTHITGYRFFRTIGPRVAVFSEFIDGESLKDAIYRRNLPDLAQILDYIIQSAWGLHVAHTNGVVHQDVKPGNILLTRDGTAKITDFGIAGSRSLYNFQPSSDLSHSPVLVTVRGLTPAFASPEQVQGDPVSAASDIWSLGVTILNSVSGTVTWQLGAVADEVFQKARHNGYRNFQFSVPSPLEKVFERCFQKKPPERYQTMLELADDLISVYEIISGTPYAREMPSIVTPFDSREEVPEIPSLRCWPDPEKWIQLAEKEGMKVVHRSSAATETSFGAQAITDLNVLNELDRLFTRGIRAVKSELDRVLLEILSTKASLFSYMHDFTGRDQCLLRCIDISRNRFDATREPEWAEKLLFFTSNVAINLSASQKLHQSLDFENQIEQLLFQLPDALYNQPEILKHRCELECLISKNQMKRGEFDRAMQRVDTGLAFIEKYAHIIPDAEYINLKAISLDQRAGILWKTGRNQDAILTRFKSIRSLKRKIRCLSSHRLLNTFTIICINLGDNLISNGHPEAAIELFRHVLTFIQSLADQRLFDQIKRFQMMLYTNLSLACMNLNLLSEAQVAINQAETIGKRLVIDQGWSECIPDLAKICMNKAVIHALSGEIQTAKGDMQHATALFDNLVNRAGLAHLRSEYAICLINLGEIMTMANEYQASLKTFDDAFTLLNQIAKLEDYPELAGSIGNLRVHRAETLMKLGRLHEAAEDARDGMALLQAAFKQTGQANLLQQMKWAQQALKSIL